MRTSAIKRTITSIAWRGCAFALLSAACADSTELIVVEGERVDVHHIPKLQLCGGTVEAYDRGVEFIAEQLGLDPGSFDHLTFVWLDTETLVERAPVFTTEGMSWAWRDKAESNFPYVIHEVVHLISHQDKVNASTFLTEGLAKAFEEKLEPVDPNDPPALVDPRPFFGARYGTDPRIDYNVAGTFVTYLLSRFGPERFWELNGTLRYLSTKGRFSRRFEAVYGHELDEVVDDFLSGECREDALPIPLPVSCSAEELPRGSDGSWTYARALDCAEDDVVGGLGSDFGDVIEHAVTFVIDEPGFYEVRKSSDWGLEPVIYRCGGCPWLNSALLLRSGYFEAGRYSVLVVDWSGLGGGSIGFSISPEV